MKDKYGNVLSVGDEVKIFTYTKAVITSIEVKGREEVAHVDEYRIRKGQRQVFATNTVYSEEIMKM